MKLSNLHFHIFNESSTDELMRTTLETIVDELQKSDKYYIRANTPLPTEYSDLRIKFYIALLTFSPKDRNMFVDSESFIRLSTNAEMWPRINIHTLVCKIIPIEVTTKRGPEYKAHKQRTRNFSSYNIDEVVDVVLHMMDEAVVFRGSSAASRANQI